MRVIGITGGVGSGKSTLLNELAKIYSCRILLSDDAAKDLERKGQVCYQPLIDLMGDDILSSDGEIDKKLMASKIYSDPTLLEKVNSIIHPAVRAYILSEIEKDKKAGKVDYFFLEAALLIECGYNDVVDEMWYIFADDRARFERLKASRGYTEDKINAIIKSQLSDEEFKKGSDFVIDNSGALNDAVNQIRAHLNKDTLN